MITYYLKTPVTLDQLKEKGYKVDDTEDIILIEKNNSILITWLFDDDKEKIRTLEAKTFGGTACIMAIIDDFNNEVITDEDIDNLFYFNEEDTIKITDDMYKARTAYIKKCFSQSL